VLDLSRRSLTGAWIETLHRVIHHVTGDGRSLTGAWIETLLVRNSAAVRSVAPSRERGLKRVFSRRGDADDYRRSLTGAWIETMVGWVRLVGLGVAPSRERGLKRFACAMITSPQWSLPHGSVD